MGGLVEGIRQSLSAGISDVKQQQQKLCVWIESTQDSHRALLHRARAEEVGFPNKKLYLSGPIATGDFLAICRYHGLVPRYICGFVEATRGLRSLVASNSLEMHVAKIPWF